MSYRKTLPLADLWDGEKAGVTVNGKKILLVNIGNKVRAYEDRCAHLGVALSEGTFSGKKISCRAHHWEYDAETGRGVNPANACLKQFPVKIENGDIWVEVIAPPVGPVLQTGEVANAFVEALKQTNQDVTVVDRGSYLRISVPGECVVTRGQIETILGHPFLFPGDLEKVMPAFQGSFRMTEDEVRWEAKE